MKLRGQDDRLATARLSVLSVEPYGMKRRDGIGSAISRSTFSALGRAVWDETLGGAEPGQAPDALSVLSVEPYGMKPTANDASASQAWGFQCSRSSRMG